MTDQVKLYQGEIWPSDIARYYDQPNKARGIAPGKLIQGYKQDKAPSRRKVEK